MESRLDAGGSGGSVDLAVNPVDLDSSAGTAAEIAAAMPSDFKRVLDFGDDTSSALPAWRTTAALDRCTAAWHACLAKLAVELDIKADKLKATAANYRHGDTAVRRSFAHAATGLPTTLGGSH